MTTDWNHNKLQNLPYISKPVLLEPWQNDFNSRPRSLSLGCHPDSKELKEISSKRGLAASSLEISLGSLNACSNKKKEASNNRGYSKTCLLPLFAIAMFTTLLYSYSYGPILNVTTFLASVSGDDAPEEFVSADQLQDSYHAITDEKPVEEVKMLEELGDKILQRQLRDAPDMPRVYVSTVKEDASHKPAGESNYVRHSAQPNAKPGFQAPSHPAYAYQPSNNGHSNVYHRHHHYPHHTGAYYSQHYNSHPHLYMYHAMHQAGDNHLRALHNYHHEAMARQSWLVDHMRHTTGSRPSASYTWEVPHQHTEQLKHTYDNKAANVEKGDAKTIVTSEENDTQRYSTAV